MSTPTPPHDPAAPPAGNTAAPPAAAAASSSTASVPPPKGRPPLEPLTGFRASLEHTGLPRGVLLWKPKLPSRNWLIFWTVLGSISYAYYDDRKKCKEIKEEYINKVKYLSEETIGSLDMPRKVTVYGAKWAEDDDTDRSLRYFRKYVKPYLVAAAIDYQQIPAPLHGSITRQVHASILKRRRQNLGLEARETPTSLPIALDPRSEEQRELEGGAVLVGRASLKEYMEGLKRGWTGSVNSWDWEKDVEEKIKFDGVFEDVPVPINPSDFVPDEPQPQEPIQSSPSKSLSGLSFLSRPNPVPPPTSISSGLTVSEEMSIPPSFHVPPNPLPPTPPILLLPFTNHLGFKQFPYMIYDYFTEHIRVKEGAEAAYALIMGSTRPFVGSTFDDSTVDTSSSNTGKSDTEFDKQSESWYYKSFSELPDRISKARDDYYPGLKERIDSARQYIRGEREMTDAEKKANKVVLEDDLREERRKRELRWFGNLEGYEIVKPDSKVAWDERFDGWLKVYTAPREGEIKDDL